MGGLGKTQEVAGKLVNDKTGLLYVGTGSEKLIVDVFKEGTTGTLGKDIVPIDAREGAEKTGLLYEGAFPLTSIIEGAVTVPLSISETKASE